MQRTLNFGSDFAPPGHYVPILQDHLGERTALAKLRAASLATLGELMPLIEIVGGNTTTLSRQAINAHVQRIDEAYGRVYPFYLDFIREDPNRVVAENPQGDVRVCDVAYTAAVRRQLAFVPVIKTWDDSGYFDAAENAALHSQRGIAIRHRPLGTASITGISPTAPVERSLEAIELPHSEVDLLIDLYYLGPDVTLTARRLQRLVERLRNVGDWRRVVLIGGSMPESLTEVPENSEKSLPRREWELWSNLPLALRRQVDFGDYGVQHPEPPTDGGPGMRANIRYATAGAHLVVRAKGPVTQGGPYQYRELCERLVDHDDFDRDCPSPGTEMIAACAAGSLAPGRQVMWREAGTSRHLAHVTQMVPAFR